MTDEDGGCMQSRKFLAAKAALTEMYCDTSVPAGTTLEYLEELLDDLQGRIDALRSDIERGVDK